MTIIRVIDFETTGLAPPASVIEVGTCDVDVERRTASRTMHHLCHADEVPPETRAVHHIRPCDLIGASPFDPGQIAATADMDKVTAFAAHNADFEAQWIAGHVEQPFICTYKAALRVWPDAPSHSNGALRYWLEDQGAVEIDHALTQPAHRAGPDAYVTGHLLLALLAAGASIDDMLAWTAEPRLLPRCPIGKECGKKWADVDGGFLNWMTRQETMESALKCNAQQELDRRASARNA